MWFGHCSRQALSDRPAWLRVRTPFASATCSGRKHSSARSVHHLFCAFFSACDVCIESMSLCLISQESTGAVHEFSAGPRRFFFHLKTNRDAAENSWTAPVLYCFSLACPSVCTCQTRAKGQSHLSTKCLVHFSNCFTKGRQIGNQHAIVIRSSEDKHSLWHTLY